MKKTVFAVAITASLVFLMTGCGAASKKSESSAAPEAQVTEAAKPAESADSASSSEAQATEAPAIPAESADSAASSEAQVTETPVEAGEEDGQNPVMNFIGVYSSGKSKEALVEADGMENAKITVTSAYSPWYHTQTIMSGPFDADSLTVEFKNAVMTEYTYKTDGSEDDKNVLYKDVAGKAVFDYEKNTVTITEKTPSGEVKTEYSWGAAPDMKTVTDPDHYRGVTAMDKARIETVIGYNVRSAYLKEDWKTLAGMIRYPITINKTELADSEAFLGYMIDKKVDESDRQAMNDETLLDMFVNGQGICMGSGQIWLNDPNYMTDKEPVLEIIAISGIVSKDSEKDTESNAESGTESNPESKPESNPESNPESAPDSDASDPETEETDRDFYSAPSVTVYDENGEKHKLWESSDGYWREEDGTAYSRNSYKEWQLKDSDALVKTYVWSKDDDDGGEEDFYSSPSVVVYDENGDTFTLHEGSDGYWREEDGTTYSRISPMEFQRKDGNKRVFVR